MVCNRCIMAVRKELENEGLSFKNIQLGEVELTEEPGKETLDRLGGKLKSLGFEVLDNKKKQIVEKIKNTIISLIHYNNDQSALKLSTVLEEKLRMDYHYLTTLFSSVEGITIEKYTMLQRIERVKELIVYGELTLSEIADQMGYSSVQYLSQQFKKITGFTPSQFKTIRTDKRKPLDKVEF
jgi:AraC-like DNA-binding protein